MQLLGKDLRDLLALMDQHGVRYLVVGGFAVAAHDWRARPIEARLGEVESLRRLWIEQTGDPDLGIVRVVHKRELGEPAPKR